MAVGLGGSRGGCYGRNVSIKRLSRGSAALARASAISGGGLGSWLIFPRQPCKMLVQL